MAKFIPVEPEKWAEMVKALAEVERLTHLANQSEFYRSQLQKDTCRLDNIQMQDAFKHYEAENARLKAEVERLRKAEETYYRERMNDEYDLNNQSRIINGLLRDKEQLKAEVERLRSSSFVTAVPVEQYERVVKAGDKMAREICILGPVDDKEKKAIEEWRAAKEGKQP